MLSEQSTPEALTQARERQEEARRLYGEKCDAACAAEATFNGAVKDTIEKAEALKKHVKTVTMRVESLATTAADFFKTLLDHQEEAQRHVNELSAQLSQQNTTAHAPHSKNSAAQKKSMKE